MLRARTLLTMSMVTLLAAGCGGGGSTGNTAGSGTSPVSTPSATKAVEISWDAPTTRSDGSCLNDDLGSFVVSYGEQSGGYDHSNQLFLNSGDLTCQQIDYDDSCGVSIVRCSANVDSLTAGNWYFAVQAVDSDGYRSGYSLEAYTLIN